MAKELGWIKLHRKIQGSRTYFRESFCRNMAWIDLLLLATHRESYERTRGIRVEVQRGQIAISIVELSKRWKWSRSKVFRFLNELEIDQQIEQQKNNVTTLISILNYNTYQVIEQQNEQQTGQQTSSRTL